MTYKVVEEKGVYMIMYKKTWYSRWKYVINFYMGL